MPEIFMPTDFKSRIIRTDLIMSVVGQTVQESVYSGSLFVHTTGQGRYTGLTVTGRYKREQAPLVETFLSQISDRRNYTKFPHFRETVGSSTYVVSGTIAGYTLNAVPSNMKVGALVKAGLGAGRSLVVTSWNEALKFATFEPAIPLPNNTTIGPSDGVVGKVEGTLGVTLPMDRDFIGPYNIQWVEHIT